MRRHCHSSDCGNHMTSRFPLDDDAQDWRGVVLALDETASGRAAYRVKLWREEVVLVCVMETFDAHEALREWAVRAFQFGLPKFIERTPGIIEGAELRLAQAMVGEIPAWRRRGGALANRRPSILSRREMAARRRA